MEITIESVLCINTFLDLLVLVCKLLGLLDHFFDLLLCQPTLVVGDRDLLTLPSALVLSTDIQDAVRVDLECDLNLRQATGSWRDATKLELTEQVVVLGHGPLALEDLDVHSRLVILV